MSLLWVKLANHCDKSMESTNVSHLLYFGKKSGTYVTFN